MGTTLANAPKPGAYYPNVNAVALDSSHAPGRWAWCRAAARAKGKFRPIGTIPAGSVVQSAIALCVKTLYTSPASLSTSAA